MVNVIARLRSLDGWMLLSIGLLLVTSVMVLFSIDYATGSGDRAVKQLVLVLFGTALFIGLQWIRPSTLSAYGPWLFVLSAVLLVLVLIVGQTIRGTTGWFVLGPVNVQPVELVKVLYIITLGWFFSRLHGQTDTWKPLLVSGAATALLIGLVLLQPDFGSAMMFLFIWFGMVSFVHRRRWHLVIVVFSIAVIAVVSWQFMAPYQQDRIQTFLNPERDPFGSGYNVQQSMIAVGSGRWFGRGLGLGSQSQLEFLPEQDTDFIFSVIAEELGWIGATGVLLCYGLLWWRLLRIGRLAPDVLSSLLAVGVTVYLMFQTAVNIAMNIGLAPVTGLPLPLVSAGGSSLISSVIALGLVQSIGRFQNRD